MDILVQLLPSAGTIAGVVIVLYLTHRFLERGGAAAAGNQFRNQMIMLALTAIGLLLILVVVPIGDARRGQLLSLVGILLTAAIALSSTTLLGNAMAGLMLKSVRNFRMGDFVRCGEHFGRVSERGLFHTEIQTVDRNLTTLPNLFLVTHPVTTVHGSGTIVSATVSLGYDVPRKRIEALLLEAAARADLQDPFVQIRELGDSSVTYRIAGLLTEVKHLLRVESRLRSRVMDCLHEGGVEIVSPNFMNQRVLAGDAVFIPQPIIAAADDEAEATPEAVVFDKAEQAESLQGLRETYVKIGERIETLKATLKKAPEGPERAKPERELAALERRKQRFELLIAEREKQVTD